MMEKNSEKSGKRAPCDSAHMFPGLCEACKGAPATVACKVSATALCAGCDTKIHSANPLARRHHRMPILPSYGHLFNLSAAPLLRTRPLRHDGNAGNGSEVREKVVEQMDEEAASWLLLSPGKSKEYKSNGILFGGAVDEHLNLQYRSCGVNQYQNQCSQHQRSHRKVVGSESVAANCGRVNEQLEQQKQQQKLFIEIHDGASDTKFSYTASLGHSAPLSSMERGIITDPTKTDISNPHIRPPKGTMELFLGPHLQKPHKFSLMDRESSLHRYREKKKRRKFGKMVRYASRKAYAETRLRIKGRFAKRTDVKVEAHQMFNATVVVESVNDVVRADLSNSNKSFLNISIL